MEDTLIEFGSIICLAMGTQQVWLMLPRAGSLRSKEAGNMEIREATIN